MRNLILITLLGVAAVNAQSISVGVLGGAPFQDVVTSSVVNGIRSIPTSDNFTVGPSLRIGLPFKLRFEVDALYRPYSFQLSFPYGAANVSAQQWRFPFLLQYRFNAPIVKPFVEAGVSFDHLASISNAVSSVSNSGPGALIHDSDAGVVLGAGVDVKIPFFRLSGEVRYTRQTASNFAGISNLNQGEVLLGVHF